jgi:Ribbon-helix-helix protein, copG family
MSAAGRPVAFDLIAARQQLSIDLDAEVAAILRAHAAETHLSEGEIIDRAIRAYDLRSLLAQLRERSDLGEDQALALAREELEAARAERDTTA